MKTWECIFKVIRTTNSFVVVDYVESTTKPVELGHYWRQLFHDTIVPLSCVEVLASIIPQAQIIPLFEKEN